MFSESFFEIVRHIVKLRLDFRKHSSCYVRHDILCELRDGPDHIFLAVVTMGNSPT